MSLFLDIVLMNSADDTFDPKRVVNVIAYQNGLIHFLPPGLFKSTCLIDIKSFPFNEQKCHLKFQSWVYEGKRLDLKNISDVGDSDTYVLNTEWDLESKTEVLIFLS